MNGSCICVVVKWYMLHEELSISTVETQASHRMNFVLFSAFFDQYTSSSHHVILSNKLLGGHQKTVPPIAEFTGMFVAL